MTCGKVSVQSCKLLWFPSTVYFVANAQPPPRASAPRATYHLVIQRPRVAGGTLTIALDSSVQLVNGFTKDSAYHIIRLQHGAHGQELVMRASSSHERERWLVALTAAMTSSEPEKKRSTCPEHGSARSTRPQGSTKCHPSKSHKDRTRDASSLLRFIRHNLPAAMHLVLALGDIIASIQ
ncbi:hypothetical protein PsorP6_010366 [Peronosclerospora sorghi]|uniref:Uncharacterized protein n=1 Tax=Peronosclerospora sorghi TaxID=230839 RepID=A0ACC0VVT8_9STRA|nr:hypothetical protein PsorP6_010366 [Peronosclerospora sorghi]